MKRKANFDVLFAEKKKMNKNLDLWAPIQQYHICSAAVQMAGKKHTENKGYLLQTAMKYIYAPVHANTNRNDCKRGAFLSSSHHTADCVAVSGQDTRSVTSTLGGAKALVTP